MSNYTEVFASKLDWAMPFQRTGKFPLDRTDLFGSYADAVKYAAGNTSDPDSRGLCGTSYVGQIITVYEDSLVTVYKINEDRTISEVGKGVVADDASLVVVDGVLKIKGFAEVIAAGNYAGLQPRISATGTLEWYKPDTSTVAGLQEAIGALKDTVDGTETSDGLVKKVADLQSGKVDKVEGKGLSTNDYTATDKEKLSGIEVGAQKNVKADWSAEAGTAAEILNKPTTLSAFTNDENFIDNTVSNLANYYTKTETYTKTEVTDLIGKIATIQIQIPEDGQLPETGSSNIIYLIPKTKADGETNVYDEYLWTGTKFEKIGDTTIDLSNYLTKTGDASKVTVGFTAATSRTALATGESLSILIGKIAKYLSDLGKVAFSNDYADLDNKPSLVKSTKATIATTETSKEIPYTGTFVGANVIDSTTNEVVMCDITVTSTNVTATLSAAYTNALDFTVLYI